MTEETTKDPDAQSVRSAGNAPAEELDGLFEALESRLEAERSTPWRRLHARLSSSTAPHRRALAVSVALGLPLLALVGSRVVWTDAQGLRFWLTLALCVGLVGPLAWRALRGWHQPATSGGTAAAWVLGGLLTLTALMAFPPPHALALHARIPQGASFAQHVLPCFLYGLGFALPTYALARVLGRGIRHGRLFAAAAAGLSGNLALLLHCPIGEPAHLVPAHAGVMGVATVLAWMVGRIARRARS